MPPKKDAAPGGADPNTITGFELRETKLIAAAFVSSIGPDKYNYDLMATLTGNTAGSLKKMWPVVKRKATGAHPAFAAFLGQSGSNEAQPTIPKATASKKRKASDNEGEDEPENTEPVAKSSNSKKKAPAKGRGRTKKVKTENNSNDDDQIGQDHADGGGNQVGEEQDNEV